MWCGNVVGGGTIRMNPPASLPTATATPRPQKWEPGGAASLPVWYGASARTERVACSIGNFFREMIYLEKDSGFLCFIRVYPWLY